MSNDFEDISLSAILKEAPDYRVWKSMDPVPLSKALCYAIGIYPYPGIRKRWTVKECEEYDTLLELATSACISRTLLAQSKNNEYWIDKKDFYDWILDQDYLVTDEFLKLAPKSLGTKKIPITQQRIEKIIEAANSLEYDIQSIPYGGKSTIKAICLKDTKLFTVSTFNAAWKESKKPPYYLQVEHVNKYKQ